MSAADELEVDLEPRAGAPVELLESRRGRPPMTHGTGR